MLHITIVKNNKYKFTTPLIPIFVSCGVKLTIARMHSHFMYDIRNNCVKQQFFFL